MEEFRNYDILFSELVYDILDSAWRLMRYDYDEMGYGIAYPILVLNALLKDNVPLKVNFVDKVEG